MKKKAGPGRRLASVLNRDNVAGYVFILPFIIGLLVFTLIPFLTSLYLSFTEYNVLSPAKWIGLDNYKEMFFEDPLFWTSFKVTFKFAFIQVPIKLAVSLLVALILAKAGLGYVVYPDIPGAREPGIRYIPVESLPTVSFGVYYPQAEGHPVLKRFLKILGEGMPASSSP